MAAGAGRVSTLIVGGGIGGLSLARELTRRGLPATVLERSPQVAPVGAGIIMNPNAMGVLERNGLAAEVRADAWPYMRRETRDAAGNLLAVRDYRPLYDAGKLAQGALVHRAVLHEALHRSLPEGTLRLGITARSFDVRKDKVVVGTEDGQSFEADVLVGADGIRSPVRRHLFGEVAPEYMGYRSHRLVVPAHPGVRDFTELLGRGQRIGLVPISPTRLYIWTTFNSPREPAPVLGSAGEFRALFAQFTDPRIREIFGGLRTAEGIITTDVEEVRQERWTSGRAALLGDAVHAMTPNIGQGAGMAMEDAAVLAAELASQANPEDTLQIYERRRKSRAELVVRISRDVGVDGQQDGWLACWLRNRRIRREGRNAAKMQADLERLLAFSE